MTISTTGLGLICAAAKNHLEQKMCKKLAAGGRSAGEGGPVVLDSGPGAEFATWPSTRWQLNHLPIISLPPTNQRRNYSCQNLLADLST